MPSKEAAALSCPNCGAPLSGITAAEPMTCPYCGSVIMIKADTPPKAEGFAAAPIHEAGLTAADYNILISEEKRKQAALRKETAEIRARIEEMRGKKPSQKVEPTKWSLNDLPDIYSLSSEQLVWLRKDAEKKLEMLEAREPDYDDEIRYEKWEEKHDELQAFLDDLEDQIEDKYEEELDF